ncbi:MAG: NADPH:quinone oxidoreductase family protein [Candidatus Dormibacteraeota bacterium]|nr:NADPH:quinone oxidoreductase family protein [Candidatus Dormibacteraeota bacterium]
MRALRVIETTGLAGVRVVETEPPAADPDGVLIEVRSAGLSFPDLLLSKGLYQMRPELPFTLGVEAAGVVRQAPPGSGFSAGERVTAFTGLGACAELLAAPAGAVLPLPAGLSFDEGAALTMNYHTVHFALLRRGRLRVGETVLVQGATGGVGSAAIQVARAVGARVLAVVSTEAKADVARRLGAEAAVLTGGDWRAEVLRLSGGGVDLVLDPVGGDRLDGSMRCLRPEGRLVVVGFAEGTIPKIGANRVLFRNVDVVGAAWGAFLSVHPEMTAGIAADLERMVAAGAVKPLLSAVYPLDEAVSGLQDIEERRVVGKVVVQVAAN